MVVIGCQRDINYINALKSRCSVPASLLHRTAGACRMLGGGESSMPTLAPVQVARNIESDVDTKVKQ